MARNNRPKRQSAAKMTAKPAAKPVNQPTVTQGTSADSTTNQIKALSEQLKTLTELMMTSIQPNVTLNGDDNFQTLSAASLPTNKLINNSFQMFSRGLDSTRMMD